MRRALHALLATGCLLDGNLKHENPTVPAPLDDGWEIAAPETVGISLAALAAIHAELLREDRYVGTLGLLVVKDGKLVWETYLRSTADRDSYHHLQSATKSVTSLVLGIVRDDLGGPSLDTRIESLFPAEMAQVEAPKREITLRDVLTMRSGIAFDNQDFSMEMWVGRPRDGLRYILAKPLYAAPGTRYYYRDADPQLIGYAIERLAGGRREHEIAAERLFAPLGIRDVYWQTGRDGVSLAAHGLHLRPRDLAKLGQLVLDGGEWRGRRIVSRAWLEESTAAHVDSDVARPEGGTYPYGYYWWVVPGVGFAASGHGGQFVLVVPARRMVLVQIALPDADLNGSSLPEFLALVRPLLE